MSDFVTLNRADQGTRPTRTAAAPAVPDVGEAARRFRLILAHSDHEPTAHCLAEVLLHARVGLVALEPKEAE